MNASTSQRSGRNWIRLFTLAGLDQKLRKPTVASCIVSFIRELSGACTIICAEIMRGFCWANQINFLQNGAE
jgi:hypothetical protein